MGKPSLEQAPALSLVDIRRVFMQGQTRLSVLDGVSLTLERGEIVALVGPSGAGKSTLLQIAGLLEQPNSGEVVINGRACGGLSDRKRTALRRRRLGFVYQHHHLLPEFNALENVMLPQMIAGRSRRQAVARARVLLDIVGLSDRERHRPGKLSGGEQQRVAIARALANRPLILLADEPTGDLDSRTADTVFDELLTLVRRGGLAALIATHNVDLARRMDRVLMLQGGRLVEAATAVPAAPADKPVVVVERGPSPAADTDAAAATGGSKPEPAPAWRRLDGLGRDRAGAEEAEDKAGSATSPETEDTAELLLNILHSVKRMARLHGSAPRADGARLDKAGGAPEEQAAAAAPEFPPASDAAPGAPVPSDDKSRPPRTPWEPEITIPDKKDRLARQTGLPDTARLPTADQASRRPAPEADGRSDSEPVEIPAFIKTCRRSRR